MTLLPYPYKSALEHRCLDGSEGFIPRINGFAPPQSRQGWQAPPLRPHLEQAFCEHPCACQALIMSVFGLDYKLDSPGNRNVVSCLLLDLGSISNRCIWTIDSPYDSR